MENKVHISGNNSLLFASRNVASEDQEGSVLQEFYRGAQVLVTGGTGFMGKVLVEKLLRSCPNIARIFLLVRPKKGRSEHQRIDDLLASPCFRRVFLQNPQLKAKLVPISGDIVTVGLGISDADRRLLSDVSVVFHLAATVRFDEQLIVAINVNVRGTLHVLTLCRLFNKLKSVIYVSTAYSHCPLLTIEECLYDPPISSAEALNMVETMDDVMINTITPSLLGQWPNTYTFTKAVAEDLIRSHGQDLPVAIFRPPIVVNSRKEPMPGWVDTMLGPLGHGLGMGTGIIRVINSDPDKCWNLVPCDMAINCLIATAWDVFEKKFPRDVPVYNVTIPKENEHTLREAHRLLFQFSSETPTMEAIWCNTGTIMTKSRMLLTFYRLFLHILPAFLLNIFLVMSEKKINLLELYKKIHKIDDAVSYFNMRSWQFESKNVTQLWQKLTPTDKLLFDFDFLAIAWSSFYREVWFGIRTYLAKDPPDTVPVARGRARRLYMIHRTTQLVLITLCLVVIWTTFSTGAECLL